MEDISNLKSYDSLQSSCTLGEVGVLNACDSLKTLGAVLSDETCLMSQSVRDEANGTTYLVLDSEGLVNESELMNAANDILDGHAKYYNNETGKPTREINEVNLKLLEYVYDNTVRENDGRLCMPLLWNPRVSQFLGKNYNLSLSILKSFKNKLEKNTEH